MLHNKKMAYVITFAISILLLGCAGQPQIYDGPKLSPDKVSIIKGNIGFLPGTTTIAISNIDGKAFSPHINSAEILPGVHVIGVHYYWHMAGGWSADGRISIETQAGKTYQLIATKAEGGRHVTFSYAEVTDTK